MESQGEKRVTRRQRFPRCVLGTLCETWYPGGMKRAERKGYPTDVSDEEWSFAAPYLTLMDVSAPQRKYELRDLFDALRWIARAGAP